MAKALGVGLVLAGLFIANQCTQANPWAPPGDMTLRQDLQRLNDRGTE